MINHPLQMTSIKFLGGFGILRPRITQKFGERPEVYKQFGHNGHNGVDFGPNGNEVIYAPFTGRVKLGDQGDAGYGKYIKLRDNDKEAVMAHLREFFVTDGQQVYAGDKLGLMGSTGFSSAKHLHFGLKFLQPEGSLWSKEVLNQDNGFGGSVDPLPYLICWKGTHLQYDL